MTSQQNGDRERNLGDVFDDALELAKAQQEYIDKQAQIIELHEKMEVELRRRIALLEEKVSLLEAVTKVTITKECPTCKHVYCRGDREPCRSCTRCMTNGCTNDFSDKWEPKA